MKLQIFTLCLLGIFLLGCSPCKNLQKKDLKIQESFQDLKTKAWEEDGIKYRTKLQTLYLKEQNLLKQVRSCTIDDPISYNYWYGDRLKYPSELENSWLRYQRKRK